MKNNFKFLFACLLLGTGVTYAQVGVGTTTPDASSMLEITSTTKGFLMPRMTTAERTAIATPATGLQVYDTTTNSYWYYNGTAWVNAIASGQKWVDGTTAGDIELVNPTGKENVKFTDKGYKEISKTATTMPFISGLTYVNSPLTDYNYYSNNYYKASEIPLNPATTNIIFKENISLLDGLDTRTASSNISGDNTMIVDPSNSTSYSSLTSSFNRALHYGTGTVGTLFAQQNFTRLGYGGVASQIYGSQNVADFRGIGTTSSLNGVYSGVFLTNAAGTVSNAIGNKTFFSFTASSTSVTNLYSNNIDYSGILSSYTGTIDNSYDFFSGVIPATALVTNKFGIYSNDITKNNSILGNLLVGNSSNSATAKANASAQLEVISTTKGFLMPRMTTTQRTAIATPATGLQVYDTTSNSQWFYNGTTWVEGSNSTNNLWKQDTADQISLNFPNGKDNVQYTNVGFKLNNKTNPTFDLINGTYTGYTASTRAYYNSYNEYLVKTSDIATNNVGVGTYDANNMMTIIDNSDTRVNKSTNGLRVFTSVNSNNTNSQNNVNSLGAFVSSYGTGVNTTVTAMRGGVDNAPESKFTTTSFLLGGITNRQTSTLSSMRGLALNLFMENCGIVTNFTGLDTSMQFKSAGNVTTMKGLNVGYANNGGNHTGTITTAYDLYASDYATGSTVTNPYGVYILGNNKVNYFEGKVGIGTTTPSKRMEIRDTNDVEFRVVRTGSAGLDLGAFANQEARISTSGAASYLTFFTNNGVGERMRITANGTVGIGTNAPSTTLTVNEVLHTTVGEKQYFSLTTDNSLNLVGGVAGNGTQITASFIRSAGSKAFYIGTTGKNEALYITNSGNIGINTTAPTSKLQVVGLPVHVDNAAALTAGLTAGAFYHSGDGIVRVVF